MRRASAFLALLALAVPTAVFGWGAIGHRTVTETAALLLQDDKELAEWGELLSRHRFDLGVYAIYPDTLFRKIDGHEGKVETLTHFFDIDLALGESVPGPASEAALAELPRTHAELERKIGERLGGKAKFDAIGSSPWRVEQLMEAAFNSLNDLKTVPSGWQRGTTSSSEARKVFDALYFLGVMSHYSADALVPHHATADWNSFRKGQGGLHFYFESDCVNALEPAIAPEVLKEAKRHRAEWLKAWHVDSERPAGVLYRVYLDSWRALGPLLEIDRKAAVIRPGDPSKDEPAIRKPARVACEAMRKIVIERLARGAVLTSHLWSRILPRKISFAAGAPLLFNDFQTEPTYLAPAYDGEPGFLGKTTGQRASAPGP